MYREIAKDEEAQLLVAASAEPVPAEPIRYAQLWKAAKTWNDAFEFDPLVLYIRAGVKPPPRSAVRVRNFNALLPWKRRHAILTINDGRAFIAFPDISAPKTPLERLFDSLFIHVWSILTGEPTAEQQKRSEEFLTKAQSVIDTVIGDRIANMISVQLLATEPASQRRGYGGALVEAVNDMADSLGKDSCLLAITANEPFYHSHGYKSIGTFYMGEGNPKWDQKPVAVHLLVRESRNKPKTPPLKKSTQAFNSNSILNPFQSLI